MRERTLNVPQHTVFPSLASLVNFSKTNSTTQRMNYDSFTKSSSSSTSPDSIFVLNSKTNCYTPDPSSLITSFESVTTENFINVFLADKPGEIPRGTSGGEDKLKNTRKLSTSLSTVVVSPGKEANETLSSLSSAGKLAPPGAEEDWRSGGGNKEAEWEAACECFAEKLFCQNLHALNLSWLPRNVEFL